MEQAYTITPQFVEGVEGTELVDFDVQGSGQRGHQIDQFNNTQMYYEDDRGEMRHKLEALNFEQAQYEEPDYQRELTEDDFATGMTAEDEAYLREVTGSDENYYRMVEWCRDNLPDELIDSYNRLLAKGDVNELESVISAMYNFYNLNSED